MINSSQDTMMNSNQSVTFEKDVEGQTAPLLPIPLTEVFINLDINRAVANYRIQREFIDVLALINPNLIYRPDDSTICFESSVADSDHEPVAPLNFYVSNYLELFRIISWLFFGEGVDWSFETTLAGIPRLIAGEIDLTTNDVDLSKIMDWEHESKVRLVTHGCDGFYHQYLSLVYNRATETTESSKERIESPLEIINGHINSELGVLSQVTSLIRGCIDSGTTTASVEDGNTSGGGTSKAFSKNASSNPVMENLEVSIKSLLWLYSDTLAAVSSLKNFIQNYTSRVNIPLTNL